MRHLIAFVALVSTACSQSTSPSFVQPVQPSEAMISGTVWVHTSSGVTPYTNGRIFAWIEELRSGHSETIPVDANGNYKSSVASGARVRLYVDDRFEGKAVYQPCEATIAVVGDVTRDVRVLTDRFQLGAHLPSSMLDDRPTLSGTVTELDEAGRRAAAKDVGILLDLYGLGWTTATTVTDADGRYVLCGLGGQTSTFLYAGKPGYEVFADIVPLNLSGDTTLDIELHKVH